MQTGDIERVRQALQFVPANDRDTWLKMGMGIKSQLGEAGFGVWNDWSREDESYDAKAARAVWKSIRPQGKVTVASVFHEAKANGWCDDGTIRIPTPEDLADRRRAAAERTARDDAEIARERAVAAKLAAAVWLAASDATAGNPYLRRKAVLPIATLREIEAAQVAPLLDYQPQSNGEPLTGTLLVAPIAVADSLSTLELIDGAGRKASLRGRGTKTGGYWAAGSLPAGNGEGLTLLIGEGVATVLSASQATGHGAVAAFSAGNLVAVAKAMRDRYPAATLVVLADLVEASGAPNAHAIDAARTVGGKLAIPDFGASRRPSATDYNDMAQFCGAEGVAESIAQARAPEPPAHGDASANGTTSNWPAPQPLTAKFEPAPYPIDALPPKIRAAIEEVADFVKAPVPLVVSSALAALSLAAQAYVDVKRAEKLQGPTGLFLLTMPTAASASRHATVSS